ncbi:MAG: tRNA adenosine(34) deaminase TadA [Immundisolibacteraceae bacterium]|nr:tRNA adenosine(34) deaminase TadA [Immundisolibacteraceae bacterium]
MDCFDPQTVFSDRVDEPVGKHVGVETHHYWMELALAQAQQAAEQGEVPVGAVVVCDGELVASAHNLTITDSDPTGHAEIVALRRAGQQLGNYRLVDCDLYVTLEPCAMCVGALVHARINHLYFAADDPKAGAIRSAMALAAADHFNHQLDWTGGIMAEPASKMLTEFFRSRRRAR